MESSTPDPHQVPRFTGIKSFYRLPIFTNKEQLNTDKKNIGIIGIPFDSGCTYRTGARFGPASVRDASVIIRPFSIYHKLHLYENFNCLDMGDLATNPFNNKETVKMINTQIDNYMDMGVDYPFFIGGDHTISYPILKSMNKKHGKISLIHFDSHFDTWEEYFGENVTHGTPFKRVFEEDLIDVDSSIHVGIRGTINSREDLDNDKKIGFETIFCHETEELGLDGIAKKIMDRVGDNKVYISLDVDVVDPAFAPGTGTPECGGYSSAQILSIIRKLKNLNIVGGDVVEVSPPYDNSSITAQLASTICYEFMCLV